MKEVFEKISSYNIFNFLVPGILFVIFSKVFIGYNLFLQNDFMGAFLYYFIGMIISRFGSLIIEPFLKWSTFIKFADYKRFVLASQKDEKIAVLSEVNNTYRTLLSLFILLLGLKAFRFLKFRFAISDNCTYFILIFLLLIMFLFSYRKQTNYITKRIDANI